ncbi:hypothetical protein LTR17_008076 [Elasticomyces elasticus]|nr:hypothetical protein LTR17_008076 [Elasticomyces elasticus]
MVQSRTIRLASSSADLREDVRPQPPRPHHAKSRAELDNDTFEDGGPPAKKRRLSLRHKTPTLDNITLAQSDAPRPPNSITAVRPNGQLVETINGVRSTLDASLDDVARHPNGIAAPERLIPQPPPPAQPPAVAGAERTQDRRALRSLDDGPRLKSELAPFFANYEDVVFDVQKEDEFLTVDTALYVTDDASKHQEDSIQVKGASNGTARLSDYPKIDLDVLARNTSSSTKDPLDDAHFLVSHRRAERREKQLRNIEKEKAMHEKAQLERILDGLLGHDWLKVLGITGITDGEAIKYKPKRDYYIREVRILVNKFRLWKEQEKRQRMDREAAAAREAESEESRESTSEPASSEKNASASRQLQQETLNSVKSGFKIRIGRRSNVTSTPTPALMPPPQHIPPQLLEPITSFYAKRHLRDAALSKTRHAGRNVTAFGHAVPELEDREFKLPDEYVTEEALRASARERRRRKRGKVADAAEGASSAG